MPSGEIYVQLSVHFPNNRKVRALDRFKREARPARDLYVQMCLHCKENKTDGFVSDDQLGLLVFPDPPAIGERDARHLVEVGLIEKAADGYIVTGWLERNPSREAIRQKSEAKARGARLANHRRWHVEHENPDPTCEWCQKDSLNSDQNTDLSTDQSSDQPSETMRLGVVKRSDSSEKETESETETETVKTLGRQEPAVRKIEPGSDNDPDFCAFWDVYPRKEAKGQARKAWKTATVKRGVDAKVIILGAERYRDDPRRDRNFTAHPGTWLNGERWLEQNDPQPDSTARRINYPASPWAQ
jgi:hypothetical protein